MIKDKIFNLRQDTLSTGEDNDDQYHKAIFFIKNIICLLHEILIFPSEEINTFILQ